MKKTKRLLLLAAAVILLTVSLSVFAGAASEKSYLIYCESGDLFEGESKSYNFSLPSSTEITLFFYGDDDDYEWLEESTYGSCDITIKDKSGKEVFSKHEYFTYDDETYSTFLSKGDYVLTLKSSDWSDFTYGFSLYYTEQLKTEKLTLNYSKLVISNGKSTALKATAYPQDKAEPVTWSSSNTAVATVDKNGAITAKAFGNATVTATSGSKKATCAISVTGVDATIDKGKKVDLSKFVKFISNSKNGKWSSSKKSVATVNSAGVVTGVSVGKCDLVFKAKDKKQYKLSLSVYSEKVRLLKNKSGNLYDEESVKYSVNMPADGRFILSFDRDWTYGSCIVTITDSKNRQVFKTSGRITNDNKDITCDLKKGKYTVKITADEYDDFEYQLSAYYSTATPVKTSKLKLDKTSLKLSVGKTARLKATVTPSYTTDNRKWSSSNKKIASVDQNGKITAKAMGKVTITVKSGSKSAKCKVTVEKANITVLKGKTVKLSSYVKRIPDYKKGKWSSSNSSVATVSSSGVVKGKNPGSCSVVFKAPDGMKYTFSLKVKSWVTAKVTRIKVADIYNDCWVKIENNTDKAITYVTMTITQYDNRGYRLESPYDYYYINDTLPANYCGSFLFWVDENTRSAKVKINKVWFSDGTTYTP